MAEFVLKYYLIVASEALILPSPHDLTIGILGIESPLRGHCIEVSRYGLMLSAALKLSLTELELVFLAGRHHDLAKIAIPSAIVDKPGRLTTEEYEIMKQHAPKSAAMIENHFAAIPQVALYVRHHHERYDGNGYPDKLAGENIPLGARILAVADTYVTITEPRCYKPSLPTSQAIAEIERVSGNQLDPNIARIFLENLHSF